MKGFLLFLGILSLLFPSLASPIDKDNPMVTTVQDQAEIPILTPSLKERKTRKLRLENGLEALLISEPSAKQSSAALSVEVGGWSDPEDLPGTAHFLEHMLFMGNEKYPEESAYRRFIDEHGGQSNAFTAIDFTNYIFSINNDAFEGALDRFAHFFISPLFTASATGREQNAVDQEFSRAKENDMWRSHYISHATANQNHPFSKFYAGNKETLDSISREDLIKWYQKHYSANLMHLVLYSPLPLDTLQAWATDFFSAIPNQNNKRISIDKPLFTEEQKGLWIYIDPIKDKKALTLTWEIPVKFTNLNTKPHIILGHLLGHEGKESLLAELKKEDLATGLSAGGRKVGQNQATFSLNISLTDKGLKDPSLVIERCFEAIRVFEKTPIPKYLFEELQATALQSYQYQSKDAAFQIASQHASNLTEEGIESYPEKLFLFHDFAPEEISSLCSYLQPKSLRATLSAKEKNLPHPCKKKEPWTKASYDTKHFTKAELNAWEALKQTTNAISLPSKNPFVARSLSLIPQEKENKENFPHPILIEDSDFGKAYFCQDQHYLVPKVYLGFTIKTPSCRIGDARTDTLKDLYVYAVNESLKSLSYPASVADLDFSISSAHPSGISFTITGNSPKAPMLLEEVLKHLSSIDISEQQFSTYKELISRSYENFEKQDPIHQAIRFMDEYLLENISSYQERLLALKQIDKSAFISFCQNLYKSAYIEAMLYGNLNKETAKEAWNLSKKILHFLPYPEALHEEVHFLDLDPKKAPYLISKKTKMPRNAVVLAIEEGAFTFEKRAAQQILSTAIEEPFFNELRTKQQTAYVVWNWALEEERALASFFAIESASHDTRDLLARFEQAIEQFLQELEEKELPEERFAHIKNALINKIGKPPENLFVMGRLLSTLAFKYDGDFDWIAKRVQGFTDLSYDRFISLAHSFYGRENKKRLALLLNGRIPKSTALSYRSISGGKKHKSRLGHYLSKKDRAKASASTSSEQPEQGQ